MLDIGLHDLLQKYPFSSRGGYMTAYSSNSETRSTIFDSRHRHLKPPVSWKHCCVSFRCKHMWKTFCSQRCLQRKMAYHRRSRSCGLVFEPTSTSSMFVRASRWWKMFPAVSPRVLSAMPPWPLVANDGNTVYGYIGRRKKAVIGCGCGKAILGRLHKCHITAFVPFRKYTNSITLSLIINQNHRIVLLVARLEAWPPLRCLPR